MFTGIVTDIGEVLSVEPRGDLKRLRIACAYDADTIALGASIAHSGVCLTIVAATRERGRTVVDVDAAAETLAKTTVGSWTPGTRVNLERALKVGDELGGHIVTGHVDGVAEILAREAVTAAESGWGATARFIVRAPRQLAPFIAEKGSVALDGTSLTVNSIEGTDFSVLLVPHTLEVTTWDDRKAGDALNIEIDLMARYAARLAEARGAGY
jgi:riboflavin synthase